MTALSDPLVKLPPLRQWQLATWQDYESLRDAPIRERMKLAFNNGRLWWDMGGEGINHSAVSDLFTMILGFWAFQHSQQMFTSLGRCLLEKPETQACAPDLVLYVGAEFPVWQPGEPRRVDLLRWRIPDLVGEISDTTLTNDLDEQKHLYAALGIPEYWVVDVRGQQVFAFQLINGDYQLCTESLTLTGLSIALLSETLQRMANNTNTQAATWFAEQMRSPN